MLDIMWNGNSNLYFLRYIQIAASQLFIVKSMTFS